ncbi:hypothetical protein KR222_000097, partial [Zaprionus bogoriensis]
SQRCREMAIDSALAYRPLWFCFRLLAPTFFGARSRAVYIYVVLLHFLVTLMFPLHLLLGLLLPAAPAQVFQNLTMSLTCAACSLKHAAHIWHLRDMVEIEKLLLQLDECVKSDEEQRYYHGPLQCSVNRITRCIYISFAFIYLLFVLSMILVLMSESHELIYHAWFPFDWRRNRLLYGMAFGFQLLCILIEGAQGITNDIYTPLTLCYLSGHIHLMGIRLSRLGFDVLPRVTIHQQLSACVQDYALLMRLHQLTRATISVVQLVQLVLCGANLCVIVSYVLFFVRDTMSLIYNVMYFAVICIQLFPSCYFASVLAEQSEDLPYAIFSSNWYEQSNQYRRNVLVFVQLTLRLRWCSMMAGGLIELNLKAFFATVKMAYSLFAVVAQAK